jgi:anti-sigma28 factor (negative regulator of flagellin synthesis)
MTRNELVKAAVEAGIAKAHSMKSAVLEEMLANMSKSEPTGKRGRPVNPNSVRQVRINELETKRANGELKRGRPVDTNSVRQARLTELETKRANGELKLGRPVNSDSVRQKRLAEMEAKRANGELRRGRPKKVTDETAS